MRLKRLTLSIVLASLLAFGANAQPMEYQGQTINQTIDGKKEGPWVIFAKMRNLKGYKPDDKYEEGNYKANRKVNIFIINIKVCYPFFDIISNFIKILVISNCDVYSI